MHVRRVGTLVESIAFNRETPTQYPCCVGTVSE